MDAASSRSSSSGVIPSTNSAPSSRASTSTGCSKYRLYRSCAASGSSSQSSSLGADS